MASTTRRTRRRPAAEDRSRARRRRRRDRAAPRKCRDVSRFTAAAEGATLWCERKQSASEPKRQASSDELASSQPASSTCSSRCSRFAWRSKRASGPRPDTDGALRLVAEQPFGSAPRTARTRFRLPCSLAPGRGARDRSHEGNEPKGLAKRLGYAALAVWYAALAALTGTGSCSGTRRAPGGKPRDDQRRVRLAAPGRELIAVVGLGLIAAAVASLVAFPQASPGRAARTDEPGSGAHRRPGGKGWVREALSSSSR